jgi:hypothetical protein
MTKALKLDQGKIPLELLPFESLSEVGKVLAFGAEKYGRYNWRSGMEWTRLVGAVLRHLFAWTSGESKDPESGLSHLAHAACGVLFLLAYELNTVGVDDRYAPID